MKLLLVIAAMAALSVAQADDMSSIHLRVRSKGDKGSCTITNESQCNGQNWSGSTCCADSNYECRWDDNGGNVQRCQKKRGNNNGGNNGGNNNGQCTITNESQCDGQNWSGSTCCADKSYECRWDDNGGNVKRCQKKKGHHHHHKGSCTITNESQCDGQNWTGSTCCADSSYECRWDDNGGDVKRCQKIVDDTIDSDDYDEESDASDYADESDYEDSEESDYEDSGDSYDDGECTITNESQCDGENWTDSTCCADADYECRWDDDGADVMRCQLIEEAEKRRHSHHQRQKKASATVDDWGNCLASGSKCKGSSQCVVYSQYYAQCKPATLPAGELCGQNDGTNVWKYDHCPSGQTCKQNGKDFRCA